MESNKNMSKVIESPRILITGGKLKRNIYLKLKISVHEELGKHFVIIIVKANSEDIAQSEPIPLLALRGTVFVSLKDLWKEIEASERAFEDCMDEVIEHMFAKQLRQIRIDFGVTTQCVLWFKNLDMKPPANFLENIDLSKYFDNQKVK